MKREQRVNGMPVWVVALALWLTTLSLAGCGPPAHSSPEPTLTLTAPPQQVPTEPNVRESGSRTRTQDGMDIVHIPAGQFEMGSRDAELDAAMAACSELYSDPKVCRRAGYAHEQPVHSVALDAYWIDRTEVTNAQFAKFLNELGNQKEDGIRWLEPGKYGHIAEVGGEFQPSSGKEDYPVIEVSWYGAAAYCDWVGGRLPTEAEWEYAARGPDSLAYPWGNAFNGSLVNYRDAGFTFQNFGQDPAFDDGHDKWAPVGSYPQGASWCGALDMAGNVWEWVGDWWAEDGYALSSATNPQGPESGTIRIARGGSWYDERWCVRAAHRKGLSPSSFRMHWVGFRCVEPLMSADEP